MSAATVGPVRATVWPRRRILLALLVVSAVLNLFFIAAFVWTRLNAPPGPTQRYERMARELQLDSQQQSAFDKYIAAMRDRDRRMHQEIAPLIGGAWDAMADPQAGAAQIMQRFDGASEKWREFQREATVRTLAFLATLSPAQRAKFIAIHHERRAQRQQRDAQKH